MDEAKLTAKEQRFVANYIGPARFNGAAAARLAGYSPASARQIACELLTKPHVRARVDALLAAESLTATEILHELTATALAPTSHFMQVVLPEQTDESGTVVAPMVVRQDYGAKLKALELLGKNKKMFTENVVTTNTTVIREYADGDE